MRWEGGMIFGKLNFGDLSVGFFLFLILIWFCVLFVFCGWGYIKVGRVCFVLVGFRCV